MQGTLKRFFLTLLLALTFFVILTSAAYMLGLLT